MIRCRSAAVIRLNLKSGNGKNQNIHVKFIRDIKVLILCKQSEMTKPNLLRVNYDLSYSKLFIFLCQFFKIRRGIIKRSKTKIERKPSGF